MVLRYQGGEIFSVFLWLYVLKVNDEVDVWIDVNDIQIGIPGQLFGEEDSFLVWKWLYVLKVYNEVDV